MYVLGTIAPGWLLLREMSVYVCVCPRGRVVTPVCTNPRKTLGIQSSHWSTTPTTLPPTHPPHNSITCGYIRVLYWYYITNSSSVNKRTLWHYSIAIPLDAFLFSLSPEICLWWNEAFRLMILYLPWDKNTPIVQGLVCSFWYSIVSHCKV